MSTKEKIRVIHDYIINNTKYDVLYEVIIHKKFEKWLYF